MPSPTEQRAEVADAERRLARRLARLPRPELARALAAMVRYLRDHPDTPPDAVWAAMGQYLTSGVASLVARSRAELEETLAE